MGEVVGAHWIDFSASRFIYSSAGS
jgi:hypothetical protein